MVSVASGGQCCQHFHFKSMSQTTVRPFDMKNAITSSDPAWSRWPESRQIDLFIVLYETPGDNISFGRGPGSEGWTAEERLRRCQPSSHVSNWRVRRDSNPRSLV